MVAKVVSPDETQDGANAQDVVLLARIAKREEAAFVAFVTRYQPVLTRYIGCHLWNEAQRGDCLQDVLLTVLERAGSFQGRSSVKTWVLGIARFKVLHVLRKTPQCEVSLEAIEERGMRAGWGASHIEAAYDLTKVRQALHELPATVSEILVLRDLEGLSTREAAEVLHISEAAVKSRVHRARLMLMAHLNEENQP